jgi:hypothetical protein
VVASTACRLDMSATATLNADGSGRFALRFVVDKELADLARNAGQDTFTSLCNTAQELSAKGWTVDRSNPEGGLVLSLERRFSGPADLHGALGDLSRCLSARPGSNARFFELKVGRSRSILRRSTSVQGSIDLTGAGLLADSGLDDATKKQLQTFIEQSGNQFFKFKLTARMPGGVSRTEGEPVEVNGGGVTWSPQLGKKLEFRATASSNSPAAFAVIAGPIALAVAAVVVALARKRRRVSSA